MRKLLSANFARLRSSKLFRLELLTAVGMAGLFLFANQFEGAATIKHMDYPYFNQFIYNPIIFAAFTSLWLGTEYSDGTMRNKLVAGHSRLAVYGAHLVSVVVVSLLVVTTQIAVTLTIGPLVFEAFRFSATEIVVAAVTALLVSASCAAIYTALAMNIQNKASGVIVSIAITIGLLLLTSLLSGVLYAPEMVYEYVEKTATGLTYGPEVPNPGYIRGIARSIAEWVYDIIPNGQLLSVSYYDFERCHRWPLISIMVFMTASACGYGAFRKKDMK